MSIKVAIYRTLEETGAERWDSLARACAAPVFYRAAFLAAFERFPLHASDDRFYIVGEAEDGRLAFALPVYALRAVDPMKVLAGHFPDAAAATILLTHVWHCYDTWLLATTRDPDSVRAVLDTMARLAADIGAAHWGFANVDADGPLARALDAAGLAGRDVDERFSRDLSALSTVADYLAVLNHKARGNLTRYRAFADRAGVLTTVRDGLDADLDGFVALARQNAAKYDNADYYRPGLFQDFVRALGPHVRVVEHHLAGRLIGAALLLVDDTRLHFWLAGNNYDAVPQVSPFYLCFLTAMTEALATDKATFDGGRRNPTFKRRYGLQRHALRVYLVSTATGRSEMGA